MQTKQLGSVLKRSVLCGIPLAVALVATSVQAQNTIYRETFGRPPGNEGGDMATTVFGWQDFLGTGAVNTSPTTTGINGSSTGRPDDVANVNAGSNSDGTTGAYANGIHFYVTGTGTPVLTYTPEYAFNPAEYIPGTLTFSWYEGNANAADTMRLALQVGGAWYAHSTAFSSAGMGLGSFATLAEQKSVVYDPTAANWLAISFDGSYDGGNPGTSVDSTVPLALGAAPGADLSGVITAFGLYVEGAAGTRRFDTFQIDGTLVPEPGSLAMVALGGLVLTWGLRRRRQSL